MTERGGRGDREGRMTLPFGMTKRNGRDDNGIQNSELRIQNILADPFAALGIITRSGV